jgi:hypothetical protein
MRVSFAGSNLNFGQLPLHEYNETRAKAHTAITKTFFIIFIVYAYKCIKII